jgi:hypothetical protein
MKILGVNVQTREAYKIGREKYYYFYDPTQKDDACLSNPYV